ncbi:hypothetical protein BDK92_1858 [Micromonospora pisi]|uniref:Signal transduction histidine kinase n=1 Tax=Micromonospora pisi TaxID=589240 RepID=A0A495JG92_9ACTN|nr:hypothetical protein [Micromonospora pisi]RKR87578.1 hypothetical protein BDK92_1858 [Micromonospora pisi]
MRVELPALASGMSRAYVAGAAGTPPGTGNPARDVVADVAATADRGSRVAAVLIAFGWHLAINVPAIVGSWSVYRAPWTVGVGWLVFVVVGAISAAHLLRGTPTPTWRLIAVLLLVEAVVFVNTPATLLFQPANWGWGTLGWFVVLVLWGRPVAPLVAVFAIEATVALVAVFVNGAGNAAGLSRYAMYTYGTATLPIAFSVAASVLRTLAARTAGTATARAALEAERIAAQRARAERQERLSLVNRTAGAILTELAEGRADPTDPAVQRRCALEASRLRRLIAESDDVPDPLLHELRAAVDIAERNGLLVELVAVGTLPALPVHVRRRLAEPLTATLASAQRWARLTVVAEPAEVVVSLVTSGTAADPVGPAPPVVADEEVEYVYERDGEQVWAQTRWRAS